MLGRSVALSGVAFLSLLSLVTLVQCSDIPGPCDDPGACATSGGPGTDGGEGGPNFPAGCDPNADPKDAPKCVVDDVGVFVDASGGNDSNPGTKASPVKTIGSALTKLTAGKSRIYICAGSYPEQVKVTTSVGLYGGFACGSWAHDGNKPRVQPTDGTHYALDIKASKVTIEDLELVGPELGKPNSIAVRVVDSNDVLFVRAKLEGRKGEDGAKGTRIDFTDFPTQSVLDGQPAIGAVGGLANPVTCPGGSITTGGKGGDNGSEGSPGSPPSATAGGAGGVLGACVGPGSGQAGAPGQTLNGSGAAILGEWLDGEWRPTSGRAGTATPGQGGGGGLGFGGGGGGGGGAGGCPGASGSGGAGGGASVALLAIAAGVVLRTSGAQSGGAGNGGAGESGQPGQAIFGFAGTKEGGGCNGGEGGRGALGGAGGGGAGGLSAVITYRGIKPIVEATPLLKGSVGTPGLGGIPGTNDGVPGDAQEFYEVK